MIVSRLPGAPDNDQPPIDGGSSVAANYVVGVVVVLIALVIAAWIAFQIVVVGWFG